MAGVFKRTNGKYWIAKFRDGEGIWRHRSTGMKDKRTASDLAHKWEANATLEREGMIDPAAVRRRAKAGEPIGQHLAGYEAALVARGRSPQHVRQSLSYCREVVSAIGAETVSDITAEAVERYLTTLRAKPSRVGQAVERVRSGQGGEDEARPKAKRSAKESAKRAAPSRGLSHGTIRSKLVAIKSLVKWLIEQGVLAADPLAAVKAPSPQTDRRLRRRFLLVDEWPWLHQATEAGPIRLGMTGPERALLYTVAVETGYRSNELRHLTRGQCRLTGEAPHLVQTGDRTKNKQDARQQITKATAARLLAYLKGRPAEALVFPMGDRARIGRMLRDDLAAARATWLASITDADARLEADASDFLKPVNDAGELLDFHSLRHTCGTWLVSGGEQIGVVQKIMRHSTVTLTLGTYGHLLPSAEASAVEKLAAITGPKTAQVDP